MKPLLDQLLYASRVSVVKQAVLDLLDLLEKQESLDHRVHLVSLAARDSVDLLVNVESGVNLELLVQMGNLVRYSVFKG